MAEEEDAEAKAQEEEDACEVQVNHSTTLISVSVNFYLAMLRFTYTIDLCSYFLCLRECFRHEKSKSMSL